MSKPLSLKIWACALCMVLVAALALALPHRVSGRSRAASASVPTLPASAARSRIQATYAALPLAFEPNQGQSDPQVKYMARGNGYTVFLTSNDAVLSLQSRVAKKNAPQTQTAPSAVVRMHLVGAKAPAKIEGAGLMAGKANYFIGSDPAKWRSGIARFARVSYENIYPGVNMAFHGAERELEFDFVVAPGADPSPIGVQFRGNRSLKTDSSGNMIIASAAGDVLLHKPLAYQEQNGARQPVDARFVLKANNQISFELGTYDRSRELVIDPSVSYSTYLGGSLDDAAYGIAFDGSGNAYVTGQTASANFPGSSSANKLNGTDNAFVTEIKADGSGTVYSTYVGGSVSDSGNGIALDASGNAFVAGGTQSPNFPTTTGAYQTALKAGATSNAFIVELNPSGALTYGTYLGGSGGDVALGVALDSSGNVYAAGKTSSGDFPLKTALSATIAGGFISKLTPAGGGANDLVFSTYIGSNVNDFATAVAVASGSTPNVYITGSASSSAFLPAPTAGVLQGTYAGGISDAFVIAINSAGTQLVYSTFLGGSDVDIGNGIAVDASGNAYIIGQTASSNSSTTHFPLTSGALQGTFGGGTYDAFVSEVNATGTTLLYSTYLGGNGNDVGAGIALDGSNNAYVTGQTTSTNLTLVSATQTNPGGGIDAFVGEINPTGTTLLFSTYLGGSSDEDTSGKYGAIAVDNTFSLSAAALSPSSTVAAGGSVTSSVSVAPGAGIYVTGSTASTSDFPSTTGSFQPVTGGQTDAFVVKYSQSGAGFTGTVTLSCTVSPSPTNAPSCTSTPATAATPGTLTVNTVAASAQLQHGHSSGMFYAMFLPMGAALLGFAGPRRKKLLGVALLSLALGSLLLLPACGGGSSTKTGGGGGTPAGTYTITVNGTATGATQTGTAPSLTLVVN